MTFKDKSGEEVYPVMGCFGIGITRLMGVIVECFSDEKGIVWPESVAPFRVHLLSLGMDKETNEWYEKLQSAGIETLFDDREVSAGRNLAIAIFLECRGASLCRNARSKRVVRK